MVEEREIIYQNCNILKVSGREEYELCTESQEELDGWVNAIRESIQQDKERQPIPQNADKNEIIICSYNINFGLCDLKQYGVYGSEEAETVSFVK